MQAYPIEGPVDGDDRTDQVAARHRAEHTRVARLVAVVTHDEVPALRDAERHPAPMSRLSFSMYGSSSRLPSM
jgi:hypothetical protein